MAERDSLDAIEARLLAGGYAPRRRGDHLDARCPAHDDHSPSLSITWESGKALVCCHAGCLTEDVMANLGLLMHHLYDESKHRDATLVCPPRFAPALPKPLLFDPAPSRWSPPTDSWMPCQHKKVAEYVYTDEADRVLFGVARCERKGNGCEGFRQWRWTPTKPYRKWSLTGRDDAGVLRTVRTVPFHLPALRSAVGARRTVFLAEGEKDVLALEDAGQAAACNHGGAMKWTAEHHALHLREANVVVVADNDVPGRKHAELVVSTLMPLATSITVVTAAAGKDAHSHLAAGLAIEQFQTIWQPKRGEDS